VFLGLVGCAAEEPEPVPESWCELGYGEESWSAAATDDPVEIVLGPQGGYMIAFGLQASGIEGGDPSDPTVTENPRATFQARLSADPDGDPIGSITVMAGLTPVEGVLQLVGIWLILDPTLPLDDVFNQPIDVTVDLVTSGGVTLHDQERLLAWWPGGGDTGDSGDYSTSTSTQVK